MARSSDFFESSSIQNSDERIEASGLSMVIIECETSAQIGEGLTRFNHFSGYRNCMWGDSSSILA